MKKIISIITLAALMTGCQATQRQNATTGEMETNSATKGAIAGVLAGVAVGLATGDDAKERKKYALRGAAAGGLIGAGTGYYMDQQEEALRLKLANSGVQVRRIGENELQLVMENGIGFSSGSYSLSSNIYSTLNGIALILVEYPDTRLDIIGHTDSSGSDATNQKLSEQRAQSVANYLIRQNVASGRVASKGFGERFPICTNSTSQGKACNRRVEINILSLK